MTLHAPSTFNNLGIILPTEKKLINKNIYYLIKNSGFKIYDTENNYYGISTGYSLRPTYKTCGAIGTKINNKEYWIRGNVKYIEDNNYILDEIIVL